MYCVLYCIYCIVLYVNWLHAPSGSSSCPILPISSGFKANKIENIFFNNKRNRAYVFSIRFSFCQNPKTNELKFNLFLIFLSQVIYYLMIIYAIFAKNGIVNVQPEYPPPPLPSIPSFPVHFVRRIRTILVVFGHELLNLLHRARHIPTHVLVARCPNDDVILDAYLQFQDQIPSIEYSLP